MKYCQFILLLAAMALSGCQSGTTTTVSPNSELGRQMLQMDAKGRASQNAPNFSQALSDYELAHGASCTNVTFDRLQEPGQRISRVVQLYTMEGTSPTCGKRIYHARITFADEPRTVARRVEVLLGPDDDSGYREKAMEFIRYAQAGDVQQMLAITSPISLVKEDERKVYADQVVPQFQGAVVKWESLSTPTFDERKNIGLVFTGTASGKKTFAFGLVVFRENGKLVVGSIRKLH